MFLSCSCVCCSSSSSRSVETTCFSCSKDWCPLPPVYLLSLSSSNKDFITQLSHRLSSTVKEQKKTTKKEDDEKEEEEEDEREEEKILDPREVQSHVEDTEVGSPR